MEAHNREWLAVSASSQLRALDIAVTCASALFWSWLTLATLSPTFYFAWDSAVSPSFFQLISLGCGAFVFLSGAIKPDKMTAALDSRRWETIADAVAVIGGGIAIAGSHLAIMPVSIAGAVLIGLTFPYFTLEWTRIYSRRGAHTAVPLMSGALALSVLIDVAAFTFQPLARTIWVALMPALIVGVLYLIQALLRRSDELKPTAGFLSSNVAIGASESLVKDDSEPQMGTVKPTRERAKVLCCPISLFLSSAFYGIAFGVFKGDGALGRENLFLVIIGFLASALIFAAACLQPKRMRPLIDGLQLIGLASAVCLCGLVGYEGYAFSGYTGIAFNLTSAATFTAFVSFFVATWALVSYFSTSYDRQVIPAFSLYLTSLILGYCAGFLLQSVLAAGDLGFYACFGAVAFLAMAAYLLSMSGSLPVNVFEIPLGEVVSQDDASIPSYHSNMARQIAEKHSLTERETEILGLLISGRSRPRIAETLFLSENTVNSHIQRIYRKLDIHSFQELLDYVYNVS